MDYRFLLRVAGMCLSLILLFGLSGLSQSGDRCLSQECLFRELMTIESYQEGIELLEAHAELVDFSFISKVTDLLGEYAEMDFQAALLVNRVLTDSAFLIGDKEGEKNALGWCLGAKASIYAVGRQDSERAERLYRQALSKFETPPKHVPGIAATSANLGDLLVERGNYAQALELYRKSADLYESMNAPLGGAKSRKAMGKVKARLGEYEEAELHYQRSLDLVEDFLSFSSLPEGLRVHGKKTEASIYLAMGELDKLRRKYEEATSYTKTALKIYHSTEESQGLLRAMLNLGEVCLDWGHVNEAITYYRAVKSSAESVLAEFPDAAGFRLLLTYAHMGLAQSFSVQGKVKSAADSYEEALSLAEESGNRRARGTACFNFGSFLANIGRYDEAKKNVLSALSIFQETKDWQGIFQCFGLMIRVETKVYNYSQAQHYVQEMRDLLTARETVEPTVTARYYSDLAGYYLTRGDLKVAEEHYNLALEELRGTESFQVIDIYINLANLHVNFGSFDRASRECQSASRLASRFNYQSGTAAVNDCRGKISLAKGDYLEGLDFFQRELEIARGLENPTLISKAFRSLGQTTYQMGRMADALRYFHSALEALKERDYSYRDRASIYQGIGAVYSSMGDLENSLENYNKTLQILERLNDLQGLGSCYARLGAVRVQQGEYDAAKPYFTSALRYLKESGNTTDVGFIHINLGYLYKQLGKNEQAAASLNQALQVADRTDNELIKALTLLHLGDIAFSREDLSAALSRYEGAKDSLPALGLPLMAAKVYTKIGDIHRQQGDTKDAREAYQQAIVFLEDSRERMQVGEFKLLWPKLGLKTYHKYVRLLVEEGDFPNGLYYAERCKAKNLVDLMARGSTGVEDQGPLHIVRREEELYREISRLEDQLYEEWRKPGGKNRKSRIQDIKEVISYKKNQYTDLLTDMKLDAPQFLSLKSVQPQQLRFANQYLRGELSGDEVIVEYLVTDNETIAWIIGEEGITGTVRISLSREELVDLVTDYRETLTDSPPPESMMLDHLKGLKKAKGLYESLIEPIANYINGKKHLIIVPSDVLFYLPFEALYRCLSCEGEDLLGGHYLIEDYSISYAPSIASLYWPYQSQDNGGYRSILAVGNPTGDLSSAEEEAKEIASLFPTKDLLVKEEGTEESVKGLLSSRDYDVVHLSTHGVFDREVPLLSHLLFKESQQEDGVLYAREILATNLSSQLVVLSACQTALPSKLSPQTAALVMGDELQGLSQTLFVADVPSMILTLWNVDDRSTRVLMEEMYRNLEGGGSKAESLREAKLALLNGGSYYHPYFWSPFILYGVWR